VAIRCPVTSVKAEADDVKIILQKEEFLKDRGIISQLLTLKQRNQVKNILPIYWGQVNVSVLRGIILPVIGLGSPHVTDLTRE
jgi:hypothetical protein